MIYVIYIACLYQHKWKGCFIEKNLVAIDPFKAKGCFIEKNQADLEVIDPFKARKHYYQMNKKVAYLFPAHVTDEEIFRRRFQAFELLDANSHKTWYEAAIVLTQLSHYKHYKRN